MNKDIEDQVKDIIKKIKKIYMKNIKKNNYHCHQKLKLINA